MIDIDTVVATRITGNVGNTEGDPPAWSPDGQWLAFLCADRTICVMEIATHAIVRLGVQAGKVGWATDQIP